MAQLEKSFGSNTCRCTGLRPILDTVKSYAVDACQQLCQRVRDIEDLNLSCKNKVDQERKCSIQSIDSDWCLINDVSKLRKDDIIVISFGNTKFLKVFVEDEIFEVWNKYGLDSYMFIDGNTGKGKTEEIVIRPVKNLRINFNFNFYL